MKKITYFLPTLESPYTDDDYPYGYTERCEMNWFVDINKNGARSVRYSVYNGRTNNPKKDVYYNVILSFINEEGHYKFHAWDLNNLTDERKAELILALESIENLPAEYQTILEKLTGLHVEEKATLKIGKVDEKFCSVTTIKATFSKGVSRKEAYTLFSQNDTVKTLLGKGVVCRLFVKNKELASYDLEVYEADKTYFETSIDPFAEETETNEPETKLSRLKPVRKKELPICETPGTTDFDKNHYYKYKSWGADFWLVRLVNPKRDRYNRIKFKSVGSGREVEYYWYDPQINEKGFIYDASRGH